MLAFGEYAHGYGTRLFTDRSQPDNVAVVVHFWNSLQDRDQGSFTNLQGAQGRKQWLTRRAGEMHEHENGWIRLGDQLVHAQPGMKTFAMDATT